MPHAVVDCANADAAPDQLWCPQRQAPELPVENLCYETCREARCSRTGATLSTEAFRSCMAGCSRCESAMRTWEALRWVEFPFCPECEERLRHEEDRAIRHHHHHHHHHHHRRHRRRRRSSSPQRRRQDERRAEDEAERQWDEGTRHGGSGSVRWQYFE